jgi:hypothetical protein
MKSGSNRRYLVVAVLGDLLLEAGATWLRSHRLGGNLIVRCRQGHLFTTLWIPAASVKSLRFGWWRFQYCPVGRHWSVVVPVRQDELSAKQLRAARDQHDIRLP